MKIRKLQFSLARLCVAIATLSVALALFSAFVRDVASGQDRLAIYAYLPIVPLGAGTLTGTAVGILVGRPLVGAWIGYLVLFPLVLFAVLYWALGA